MGHCCRVVKMVRLHVLNQLLVRHTGLCRFGFFTFGSIRFGFRFQVLGFVFFGFGIRTPPQCMSILVCENTKTDCRYTAMESFQRSLSTDHAECEVVILHTRCGQLLQTQCGQSVCRSVRIRKNLKTASFRL